MDHAALVVPTELQHFAEIHEIKSIVLEGIGPRDIIEATLPPMSHSQRVALKAFLAQIEERCGQNFLTELMTFKDMELVLISEVPTELLLAFGAKSGLVGSA
jgi:hypothetical protein